MNTKKVISISILVTLLTLVPLLAACAAPKEEVTPVPEEVTPTGEVVVGVLTDLTGPASSLLAPISSAHDVYWDMVNKKGGIKGKMGTVTVKHEVIDTKYDVARAKEGWSRLKGMGMIMATHTAGGLCDALQEDYETDRIALVAGSVGAKCGASDWVFSAGHGGHPNALTAGFLGAKQWLKETKGEDLKVIGFIAGDVPYTHLGLVGIDDFLAKEGMTVHAEYLPAGTTDYTPALVKLKDAGCQFIFMGGPVPDAITTLKGADLLGMDKERFSPYCWTTPVDLAKVGGWELLQGMKQIHWCVLSNTAGEALAEGHKVMKGLIAEAFPNEPYGDYYAYAMVQALVMEEAIRLALDEVPPDELNAVILREDGLLRIKDFDPLGLCHSITYKPGPNLGPGCERFYEVRGEETYAVTDWIEYQIPLR